MLGPSVLITSLVLVGTVTRAMAAPNGGWTVQRFPLPAGVHFLAVSCSSKSACTAVGDFNTGDGPPFVERWDGRRWVSQPIPRAKRTVFDDVYCASSRACLAVGYVYAPKRAVVERWTGDAWSIAVVSKVVDSELTSVSCSSMHACTAVGVTTDFDPMGQPIALVERWDGRRWSRQTGAPTSGDLTGISCPSATRCFAVGTDGNSAGTFPVAQHWDGKAWRVDTMRGAGINDGSLDNVSCSSRATCIAVGSDPSLIGRWAGARWDVRRQHGRMLSDVSCISASRCVAVGFSAGGSAIASRWNGLTWRDERLRPDAATDLTAISCPSQTACVAVGDGPNGPIAASTGLAEPEKR